MSRSDYVYVVGNGGPQRVGRMLDDANVVSSTSFVGQNFTPLNTKNLTAMLGRASSSTARGRLIFIGDSFPAGYTAGGQDNLVGARPYAFPSQLANLLTGCGFNARADYAVGDGGITTVGEGGIEVLPQYDSRISYTGSGVSLLAGFNALGGSMWQLENAGDSYTFTPGKAFDTVEIITAFNTQFQGAFTIAFNGGATAYTVPNNTSIGVQHLIFVVPGGTTANSVTLHQATGDGFISSIGTRLSTAPGIEVINCGISGVAVSTLAAAPTVTGDANSWNARAAMKVLCDTNALNAIVVNGWFNDRTAGQTIGQVQQSLMTLFQEFLGYGDVIYTTYLPLDPSVISDGDYWVYQSAAIKTALSCGIPVMELTNRYPPYAVNQPLGFYGDSLHANASGQGAVAASWLKQILGNM